MGPLALSVVVPSLASAAAAAATAGDELIALALQDHPPKNDTTSSPAATAARRTAAAAITSAVDEGIAITTQERIYEAQKRRATQSQQQLWHVRRMRRASPLTHYMCYTAKLAQHVNAFSRLLFPSISQPKGRLSRFCCRYVN